VSAVDDFETAFAAGAARALRRRADDGPLAVVVVPSEWAPRLKTARLFDEVAAALGGAK
jgi:hypothetical protein